jgi:hypothetical protein
MNPDEYAFKGGGVWTYGNGGLEIALESRMP